MKRYWMQKRKVSCFVFILAFHDKIIFLVILVVGVV